MAARWTTPAASTPTYKAMKMYPQLRRQQIHVWRHAASRRQARPRHTCLLSPRSAERMGALTVMVVSSYLSGSTPATINLAILHCGKPSSMERTFSYGWERFL